MSSRFQRLIKLPFWLRAVLLGVVAASLLFGGLRSQPFAQTFAQADKVYHFAGFLALALSCRLAFMNIKLHWIATVCVLTGLLIEYAQAFIPLRTASLHDALANTFGVITGLLIAWYCTRNIQNGRSRCRVPRGRDGLRSDRKS